MTKNVKTLRTPLQAILQWIIFSEFAPPLHEGYAVLPYCYLACMTEEAKLAKSERDQPQYFSRLFSCHVLPKTILCPSRPPPSNSSIDPIALADVCRNDKERADTKNATPGNTSMDYLLRICSSPSRRLLLLPSLHDGRSQARQVRARSTTILQPIIFLPCLA